MSRNTGLFALIGTALLVVSVFAPAVSAGAATATAAGNADLGVDVTQAGDDVEVSVTKNDTGVEGADVTVEPVGGNATYEGAGEYVTDEEGVVELGAPEENVTVAVTAAYRNETANTTVELRNESYVEDGNETDAFGQEVSAYVEQLLSGDHAGVGPMVSEFVTENNPGADNRPDHAGPPEDRGPDRDDADEDGEDADDNETDDEERGPPEDRGPDRDDADEDGERGPPDHAGPPENGDDDKADEEDEADDEDDADEVEDGEEEIEDEEEESDDEDDEDRGNGNNGDGR
jgi:hypothetical protein